MKLCSLIILTLTFSTCFGQNLVPNPSFEIYDTCSGYINYVVGWSSYKMSPDYCNACATGTYSVPSNYWGYQNARTGNAYTGLATFASNIPNGREYIGVQLNQTLIIGQRYYGSFYISKVETHRWSTSTNKIGMHLSTVPYSMANPEPVDNYAQFYTDSIITDTLNWVRISGSFIADSAYNYLSIGNFFVDSLTTYILDDTINSTNGYYRIDDVYLSDTSDSTEGITDIYEEHIIKVIPNPFTNTLTFECDNENPSEIILYDIVGRKLIGQMFIATTTFNTAHLSKGIYLYEVRNQRRVIKNGKVVKE
jgi:hypothetical protein